MDRLAYGIEDCPCGEATLVSALKRPRRSACPIASALDLVGDRWSLLIVRDLLAGKRRFARFLDSAEGITTNILSDRLARLEEAGLIERRPYGAGRSRFDYLLTAKGAALLPVLQEIARWGQVHLPDTAPTPDTFMRLKAKAERP